MLSWSSTESQAEMAPNLDALAAASSDVGVPLGAQLVEFATAAADLRGDAAVMAAARRTLAAVAGEAFMIDAAAVAANFHMMTRLADGTGAQILPERQAAMGPIIDRMRIDALTSRR